MFKYLYVLAFLVFICSQPSLAQQKFSVEELKADLQFYKSKLERHHPNLYLYTSKQKVNYFFDSLYQSINQPLDEAEWYRRITLSSNLIKDGHTLILPSNSFVEYHNSNSKFLPLQVGIVEHKLYIKMNCTSTILLEDGTVIDQINGIPANEVIQALLDRQVRDGNNSSYAMWILDTYFREYYSYVFGHPDTFQISYTKNNQTYRTQIAALKKDSIYYYRQKNYPAFYNDKEQTKGISLNFDSTKTTAILTIKDFHSAVLKSEYNQNFKKEIRAIFEYIIANQAKNLVLDLRNNQGGDVENGVFLLSFLLNKAFKVVNDYKCLKENNLIPCKGPSMGYHKPNKKQFTGQIYVLVNGGSFSNSVIVSSCLKENSNAIFVGTETGGNPNVLAGYAKEFELPNTKIKVEVPTKRFVMTSLAKNNGKGVIPTYHIYNDIQDQISQSDKVLDDVLALIQKNENKSR